MGRTTPLPYTRRSDGPGERPERVDPRWLFRRSADGFFGKILKLGPTVTTRVSANLPGFRGRPAAAVAAWAAVAVWVAAWAGQGAAADPPTASVYSRTQGTGVAAPVPAGVEDASAQAERIVSSALATISGAESISLKFHQKVRIGDRVLVGAGRYLQAGRGEEQRFRYDSVLTSDTESFEVTEVCDGLFCWLHRDFGEEPERLERIDVRRIRARLAELGAPDAADGAAYLGGLQRSLRLLRHWMRFTKATPGDLEGQPVWLVEGRWPPENLALILPDMKERIMDPDGIRPSELPDGVPWEARLWIGRGDLLLRRVEWLAVPGVRPVDDTPPEPIAVLDVHDIEIGGSVDATAFFYQPATEGLADITEMQVKGLGLMR